MGDRADRVGQQIGDYRLLSWLGGGGFGDVYLGEQLREHTQVAIKLLQARLTRHEDLKEFINEARTMRLKHPHIVSLLDFGIASDDTPFLVMAYAPHGTLRDRHPKGSRLPLSIIVSYVQELSSALQYAHSLHLVHRDVKPENMLAGPNYEVLLSDFGIAAVAHSSRSLSIEQGIGGTLPYMAPEQIAGKPRTASDQYALGIVVYEWIAGRRPFTGTAAEIIIQHNTTPPPSLQEQLPTLPIDVEQVVMRALAKDPKSRFADVDEFASTLEVASKQAETPKQPPERSLSVHWPLNGPVSMRHQTDQLNTVDPSVTEDLLIPIHSITPSEVERMPPVTQPVDEPIPMPVVTPPTPAFTIHEQTSLHSSAPAPGPALPAQPPDTPLPAGAYQAPVQPAQVAWPPRMPVNAGSKPVQTTQFARPAQMPASIPPARVWATGFLLIFVLVLVVTIVGTWLAYATIGVVGGDTRLDAGLECALAFMFVIISFGATMFVDSKLVITFLAVSTLLMVIVTLTLFGNFGGFFPPESSVAFINGGLVWTSFFSLLWLLRPISR